MSADSSGAGLIRPEREKLLRIITTTAVFLALALSATLIVAGTPAQNKSSKKKPSQVSNSSPAAGKLRVRRVGAKSASEQALSPSAQPPVSDIVKSPDENSIMPAAAETKAEEEPG